MAPISRTAFQNKPTTDQLDRAYLLHERFAEQARITPKEVVLYHHDKSITFSELNTSSNRVAAFLRSRAICDGAPVGLHMERSIPFFISLLGILKSNSAVVPLPPSYPHERLRGILSFADLKAVIDHEDTPISSIVTDNVIHFSTLEGYDGEFGSDALGTSDQPAFILCSSGSTGKPKMIVRSHRSFFHRLNWTWENHPFAKGELCCQKSHMTTTHAIYELFEPMLQGIPLFIISDNETRNLELFWEIVRTKRISRLLIVPSALQASLDMPGFLPPSLKILVLMGEYVHPKLAESIIHAFPPPTRVFSIYGSTEASSTLVCDLQESFHCNEELPLGRPISADVRPYVLSATHEEVAPGEIGLLHIGGPALFREYFRNPALTASVVVRAPDGAGSIYNTQDQVRLLPDGNLRFVGRVDHTVKIRGFRVDLQEVERAVSMHPQVRQATVMVRANSSGNSTLIAFVTPETVGQADLYAFLRQYLPDYMVPSNIVFLSAFPLTSSGKTNRIQLLDDYASRPSTHGFGSLLSETEVGIYDVWQKVLGHGDIRRDGSFFEAGGTSLLVFQVVHRLRGAFDLSRSQLGDSSVYQFPTIEKLASHIEGLKNGSAPIAPPDNSILVTMKKGGRANAAPFFLVASAGGTLGAYAKLAKVLNTNRDIIGVRDPFIWGQRDPTMGLQNWVSVYLRAIRERQPQGPYYLGAYSSAAAFGYEIALRLRQDGQEVALLALIDPLAFDCLDKGRFGYWALRALFSHRAFEMFVLFLGWLRPLIYSLRGVSEYSPPSSGREITQLEFLKGAAKCKKNKNQLVTFSWLLELNTGLPFTVTESELAEVGPEQYWHVLLERVKAVTPEIDPVMLENIFVQYFCLQVSAQHGYQLQPYTGKVAIFEPDGPHKGLLAAIFRPYIKKPWFRYLKCDLESKAKEAAPVQLSVNLLPHYLCMRDDEFVHGLADELAPLLV